MHAAVIDIGKPGKNLGWALSGPTPSDGTDLDRCVTAVAAALRTGPVALGFEAPMFVPVRDDPMTLTKARSGEVVQGIIRPFSAGAGATVLVTALVVIPYVLTQLRNLAPRARATVDWRSPLSGRADLLLFEAFVTNQRKSTHTRHVEDAHLAIAAFQKGMRDPAAFASAVVEPDCLSLRQTLMMHAAGGRCP